MGRDHVGDAGYRRRVRRVLALLVLGAVPGCIPVAMFPSEHRIGGGVIGGNLGVPGGGVGGTSTGHFTYRGAIAPLAMVPELADRDFDFDLAYVVTVPDPAVARFHHGPSVALSAFLVSENLDGRPICAGDAAFEGEAAPDCRTPESRTLFRLAVRTEVDLRFGDGEPSPGIGARVGLRLDFSWLTGRPEPVAGASVGGTGSHPSASAFAGVLWGEGGIAIDLLGGAGVVGAQAYGELIAAVTFRVPAIAGVLIVVP